MKPISVQLCEIIRAGEFAVLDDNKTPGGTASQVFYRPRKFVTAHTVEEIDGRLAEIEAAVAEGANAVGYYAYELGYVMNSRTRPLLPAGRSVPLFCVGLFDEKLLVNSEELDEALAAMTQGQDACIANCRLNMSRDEYAEKIRRVKRHIVDGDTYQVNYTLKYKFRHAGPLAALYALLRNRQRVEYGALLDFPETKVISRSPELFIKKEGAVLLAKPMKGTAKRGRTLVEDEANRLALTNDEKNLAENVMIVDLLRNDLTRISVPGSVRTTQMFEVLTYETLHQMVSTISTRIAPDLSLTEVLRNVFPCGSITGAPKIRTMEIIRELEKEPRGIYTGAIGYLSPDRSLCFNVAIRSLVLWPDGHGEMGVGSGVVHDSDPEAEFEECRLKGKFLVDGNTNFQLIEALRFDAGFPHLDRHLDRLAASAKALDFGFDRARLREAMLDFQGTSPAKVRIVLAPSGEFQIVGETLELQAGLEEKKVVVASERMPLHHRFLLNHKTTLRSFYQQLHQRHANAGYYDAIVLNEAGEVTEGTFNNVFIRVGEQWYTPPLACGLLPGIQRQVLLEASDMQVAEQVLHVEDLLAADAVYLTNSVRGVVKVTVDCLQEDEACCA